MRKILTLCAPSLIAALAFSGGARFANADIIIEASIDGGATWQTVATSATSSDTITGTLTDGNFTISANALSNSPGTPSLGKLLSNTLSVINNSSATHSILIAYGAQGFTAPVSATTLMSSHLGGSVVVNPSADNSANTLAFQSYIDQANGLGHLGIPGTFTTGSQVVNATSGSFLSDASTVFSSLSGT